jgi:hypothetical protein
MTAMRGSDGRTGPLAHPDDKSEVRRMLAAMQALTRHQPGKNLRRTMGCLI